MNQRFTEAISLIQNAKTRLEVFKKEKGVSMGAKHMINGMINRLNSTLGEAKYNMSRDDWQKVEKEVLNVESSLQIENLLDLVMGLDQKGRDIIEEFIIQYKNGKIEVA